MHTRERLEEIRKQVVEALDDHSKDTSNIHPLQRKLVEALDKRAKKDAWHKRIKDMQKR